MSQTARDGTQESTSQTARDGTQAPVRRGHIDEEEYQEEEEDPFNDLEEERQHWCKVERKRDQIEEVKNCALVSNMETEVSWASS